MEESIFAIMSDMNSEIILRLHCVTEMGAELFCLCQGTRAAESQGTRSGKSRLKISVPWTGTPPRLLICFRKIKHLMLNVNKHLKVNISS